MKQIIKRVNNIFVQIILLIFYFVVVGFGSVLQKLASLFRKDKERNTYWIEEEGRYKTDFKSSY